MPISARLLAATFPAERPLLYYITDRRQLPGGRLMPAVRRALKSGIHFIQVREKDLSDRELYQLVCRVVSAAKGTSCRVLVNGRADIALAAGADGVHLPEGGLRPLDLREALPGRLIIGCSVHSGRAALKAGRAGADYLLLSPVFPTPSKAAFGRPLGIELFGRICRRIRIPILGLGGIDERRAGEVLRAGAAGIAGIRLFQAARGFSPSRASSSEFPSPWARAKVPVRPRRAPRR